ncbi:hypothetical protein K469DRAFT_720184 [Zopfia rhizophila CBS 207.26]|uniref:Uncharacterized protein n=1 Tax=Zopfia rhizophila CBS 207.26 TaxID=1314779 RepID=A0A6A6EJ92_9PEZI|nr:hypothetical protein K469DRAFT_720184 [Zopfia rhizophila CBS 207.26]
MCAAHTCFRSALAQAFRTSIQRRPIPLSVPKFLAPALVRSVSRRPFSSARTRRTQSGPSSRIPFHDPRTHDPLIGPIKPSKEPILFKIPLPDIASQREIQPWLSAIDPFLPPHLRQQPSKNAHVAHPASPIDFSRILVTAQDASQDILSYIGLVERRWNTVIWLVKKLVEDGSRVLDPPTQLEPFVNMIWPDPDMSLDQMVKGPLLTQRVRPSKRLKNSLNELTAAPDFIEYEHKMLKRAFGQVWRSLGNTILVAAEPREEGESQIMPHVLEIIAYLHHAGLIPESIYQYRQTQDTFALQQPPTLHLLSSEILTALSDATWRAHESSVKVARERMNAQYFLGHEIPGSRYKVQVSGIAPELWLELVLWTCLHGGWILDGTAILEQVSSHRGDPRWSLICWREMLHADAKNEEPLQPSKGWRFFNSTQKATIKAEDRERTQRTLSSEIVTAFIDGLINTMRVGVGARGTAPEDIVGHIKNLKQLLDRDGLSLGSASWDSVMVRLLESGGIIPEKRPELLLSILDLASGFGTEVGSVNASSSQSEAGSDPPYFFDASAVPLGLLHRTIRSFVQNGDLSGALMTLKGLQHYTDNNKKKSLREFFEQLKQFPSPQDQRFTSRLAPVEFPGFDPQLPVPLLTKVLDLITEAREFEIGRWFLFSRDLDGPLIGGHMYDHLEMSAAIIRFGTVARENNLVLEIVKRTGRWSSEVQTQRLPSEVLSAFLSSQVQLHRWESVRGIQKYVLENPGYLPRSEVLANFAAGLLRLSSEANPYTKSQKSKAKAAFTELLFEWEILILTELRNELNCILGILSTVQNDWKSFCSQFLAFPVRQSIKLSTEDFNRVLGGVLDGYGSLKGKEIVDMWCYRSPKTFELYRAPGGLPTMPRFRVGKSEEYETRPEDIMISQPSGAQLILHGRIHPNRQTVWAILRKVRQEEELRREKKEDFGAEKRAEVRGTLKWAARLLYYLGFDYEEISRDLGSLAEIAELEAPPLPKIIGLGEDDDGSS